MTFLQISGAAVIVAVFAAIFSLMVHHIGWRATAGAWAVSVFVTLLLIAAAYALAGEVL